MCGVRSGAADLAHDRLVRRRRRPEASTALPRVLSRLPRRLRALSAPARAVDHAVDEVIGSCRLLCFDEFHLHDPGDAMLVAAVFRVLVDRGIVLLTTSKPNRGRTWSRRPSRSISPAPRAGWRCSSGSPPRSA
ncbi:AFG1/ZapE family ATPase [Alloactinosynnema sp. L-07]|uniref:AFG1/ZapE family ATPase n=1 Tax=Alloactinosynnema sp. L-07 TaxID=1653480 RepID=UPI0009EDA563